MGLVAKRLKHVPNSDPPAVRVISDNGFYSPYERSAEEIHIIGRIFGIVTPFYLFEVNHARFSCFDDEPVLGNWDVFLNVLNVETEDGATGADIRQVLFGKANPAGGFDDLLSNLYIQVLRPFCWTGLLQENRAKGLLRTKESVFSKTPLWREALRLETDGFVQSTPRH